MLLVLAVVLTGCGAGGDADKPGPEGASRQPPEIYPGVLDLPAATAAGFLRCSPGGPGRDSPGDLSPGDLSLGPAPLSREFVDAYLVRPPWEPEMPSFLPVDTRENERWLGLMELRSRFLFRHDPATGGWRPDAAVSADLNVAEEVLTVRLREELVWSDGTPAVAGDWVGTVESIYQLDGVQSPLKGQTEAGGAVWRALDDTTIEVSFETIPPDPLSILAVPPLPLGDPRVASLAAGNVDMLFDLETARDELPVLRRSGETAIPGNRVTVPVLAAADPTEGLLASTGAGDRGLVLLLPADSEVSGVVEEFLHEVGEPVPGGGLLLLPWGRVSSRVEGDGPNAGDPTMPLQVRIAYSFASPGARAAAGRLAAHLEEAGVGETAVVPENADVMESALSLFLSGERPLPGDLVVLEIAVDAVEGLYDRTAAPLSGPSASVRLLPAGRLPRLVILRPSACFTEPVPSGARAIDLLGLSGGTEELES